MNLFELGDAFEYGKSAVEWIGGSMVGRMMGGPEDMGLLAQAIDYAGAGDYLEIGSYFGGSALLACLAKNDLHRPGHVLCIDPFDEQYAWRWDEGTNKVADKKTFWENMNRFGCRPELWPVNSMMADWGRIKRELGVVVAYVDGDHSQPYVQNDLWECVRLRPRFIVVDDYNQKHPAVMREVQKVGVQTDYDLVMVLGKTAVLKDGLWKV